MIVEKKNAIVFGDNTSTEVRQAAEVIKQSTILPASIGFFDSGEPFVELFKGEGKDYQKNSDFLKGANVSIIQSTNAPVNDHMQHLLMMAHSAKKYGAKHVTAILPFGGLERQDRAFPTRFTSVALDLFVQQLKTAGVDQVIRITPHSKAAVDTYKKEFGHQFKALSTTKLFANDIKSRFPDGLKNISIGAPDGADKPQDEGQLRAKELISGLFNDNTALDTNSFKISKVHTGVSDTKITHFEGNVEGKHCIIVDDMIDGGSTMLNAASLLKSKGAASVTAYATHGVFSGSALEKILSTKPDGMHNAIDQLVVTDTAPDVASKIGALTKNKPSLAERITVLSVGDLIAKQLEHQHSLENDFSKRLSTPIRVSAK